MITIAKPFSFKLLFCAVVIFMFTSTPTIAEEKNPSTIFNKSNNVNSKTMKSVSWNTPKPKEEAEEVKEVPDEKEVKEDVQKELTPEEKLWKKYKDLAEGNSEDDSLEENAGEEEQVSEEETDDDDKTEEEEKSSGILDIIKEYKDSQKNKGKMQSRSFGKID